MTQSRSRVHELSKESYSQGDYTGWFETHFIDTSEPNSPRRFRIVYQWLENA
jgi:hypothetical protein